MDILLIDYRSIKAHQNFNKIHIGALMRLGHRVTLIGKAGHFDDIEDTSHINKIIIPDRFFKKYPFAQITKRLRELFCLLWLRRKINYSAFDLVVIPTYDILSFFLFRINNKTILINHNNVSQLDNRVKLWLTKTLPNHYVHVALNELMKDRLGYLLQGKRIYHIPHGIPYLDRQETRPAFIEDEKPFIFCPINSNYDYSFLQSVFSSEDLKAYIESRGIILFVKKSMGLITNSSNIIDLSVLSDADYNYMLSHSKAVILPYGIDFKYRCSGILFECVNFNTPVLATEIDDLLLYKGVINIDYFHDVSSLIKELDNCMYNKNTIYDYSKLIPDHYWESVISSEVGAQ